MMDAKELLYMARLAEQAERYEDMIAYMKKYLDLAKDLKDMEKRNLLFNAYKMAVLSRRKAWKAISAFETKEKSKVMGLSRLSSLKVLLEFKTN